MSTVYYGVSHYEGRYAGGDNGEVIVAGRSQIIASRRPDDHDPVNRVALRS